MLDHTCSPPQNNQIWMLKEPEEQAPSDVKIKTEKKFGLKDEHVIACKNCGNSISYPGHIISVNGDHIHTYTNPEGFVYEIGCFSAAEGCAVDVDATLENTWFEGFSWSMALCSNCFIHIGWFYESDDESFFGLILDRLISSGNSP